MEQQNVEIGSRLKAERERLNLSQTELGRQCEVTQNTQYTYEVGKRSPDGEYLARAAHAGIDVAFVLIGPKSVKTRLSPRELQMVDMFRLSPAQVQDGVMMLLRNTAHSSQPEPEPKPSATTKVKQSSRGSGAMMIGAVAGNVKVTNRK